MIMYFYSTLSLLGFDNHLLVGERGCGRFKNGEERRRAERRNCRIKF